MFLHVQEIFVTISVNHEKMKRVTLERSMLQYKVTLAMKIKKGMAI